MRNINFGSIFVIAIVFALLVVLMQDASYNYLRVMATAGIYLACKVAKASFCKPQRFFFSFFLIWNRTILV